MLYIIPLYSLRKTTTNSIYDTPMQTRLDYTRNYKKMLLLTLSTHSDGIKMADCAAYGTHQP